MKTYATRHYRNLHSGHWMIGEKFTVRCTDTVIRTLTIDEVDLSYIPADVPRDEDRGLYLSGLDHAGYRHSAYVPWTHAVYVKAVNDINGNPRRGWMIVNGDGTMINFVDEGYAGTLTNATGDDKSPYPYRLGATAETRNITVTEYNRLKRSQQDNSDLAVEATEYVLQSDYGYGHGFEDTLTEDTRATYRANQPEYRHRVIVRKGGQRTE